MSLKEQFEELVEAALEDGETVDSYGDYDEKAEEGHDVELIQHGGLYVVNERIDGEENPEPYTDGDEAQQDFAEIKAAIKDEEADE
jgi:hypothetical protein